MLLSAPILQLHQNCCLTRLLTMIEVEATLYRPQLQDSGRCQSPAADINAVQASGNVPSCMKASPLEMLLIKDFVTWQAGPTLLIFAYKSPN